MESHIVTHVPAIRSFRSIRARLLASPIAAGAVVLAAVVALWNVTATSIVIAKTAALVAAEFGMVAIKRKRNDAKRKPAADSLVKPGVALPSEEWPAIRTRGLVTVGPLTGRAATPSMRNAQMPRAVGREM